jgi:LmbE family N-acetylglucosaminyl deacetylase
MNSIGTHRQVGDALAGGIPPLDSRAQILRRPHFRLVDDELFFLISKRPFARLTVDEVALWTKLEFISFVDGLRAQFSNVDETLRRLLQLGLCEIVETAFPRERRRVLIFEPHGDDAALSVGGTMWLRRHKCEFIVVTIGSRSNFTSYYYLDRDYFNVCEISSLRDAEGKLFARLVGGQHQSLGLSEAALRYHESNWTLEWHRRHKDAIDAFIAHESNVTEMHDWTEAIRATLLREPADEIWFPLGGSHTDHQLTRDAGLFLMAHRPDLFKGRDTYFYQDVPYAARSPGFTTSVMNALNGAGAILSAEVVPIAPVFNEKLRLVSLYASQFKIDAIGPDVKKNARMAARDDGLAERLWRVQKPPSMTGSLAIRCDEPIVQKATEKLSGWLRRNRNKSRIRLLLLVPAGRWAEDMQYLLRTFPMAHFDVHVAIVSETTQFGSPRIRVSQVGSGPKAWGTFAMRLMLMKPMPTLFLAGEKRLRAAQVLSRLWPMSDPLVIPTMDQLISALRRHTAWSDA